MLVRRRIRVIPYYLYEPMIVFNARGPHPHLGPFTYGTTVSGVTMGSSCVHGVAGTPHGAVRDTIKAQNQGVSVEQ